MPSARLSSNDSSVNIETRPTRDGSTSLYSTQFRQFYHNHNGAETESRHVFFQPLNLLPDLVLGRPIAIFEMGFGTGLNLLLLLDYLRRLESKSTVHFISIEGYPASSDQLREQNHAKRLGLGSIWEPFVHQWNTLLPGWNHHTFSIPGRPLTPPLTCSIFYGKASELSELPSRFGALSKLESKINTPSGNSVKIDYLFHDPFSPEVNPECWTAEFFTKLRGWATENATLRTYSASVSARMAMAAAGWFIAKAPGALGKREMTLASPSPDPLSPYKRLNEKKLAERWNQENELTS
jgi:tRNA U34 5-methylaminomethyl-2-thiouridine-forming methyltransferase MnmC